jgi:uncharacterized protein (TIGR00369 family)
MTAGDLEAFLHTEMVYSQRNFVVSEVTPTGVVLQFAVRVEHGRPGDSVSGPTMMALADAAAWLATLSRIGPVALAVTSSLTINFLRKPPLDGALLAEASLVRLGRTLSVCDVRVVSTGNDQLVATSSVTYAIPRSPLQNPATDERNASPT